MRIVAFLGAGFSSHFGLPVMTNFSTFARDSSRIGHQDKEFLATIALDTKQAASALNTAPTNLEDMLSYAMMADRLVGTQPNSNRIARLRWVLHRIFTEPGDAGVFWSRYDSVRTFFGDTLPHDGRAKHDLAIVTTNYDINIECALHSIQVWSHIGIPYSQLIDDRPRRQQVLYAENEIINNRVSLHKLHGSANWFTPSFDSPDSLSGDNRCRIDIEGRLLATAPSAHSLMGHDLPAVCFESYTCKEEPIIVPPSYLKPDLAPALRKIWSDAVGAISNCELLIFVGYSFPGSDTEMAYFLGYCLARNTNLDAIWIVDPRADEIVGRLKEANSKFGPHFQYMLRPAPVQWHEARIDGNRRVVEYSRR